MPPESPSLPAEKVGPGRKLLPWRATLLVGVLGTVISGVGTGLVWRSQQADMGQRFDRQVETRLRVFDERMGRCEDRLFALRMLFESAPEVSRLEYRRVVEELIDRLPGIQAFQWIPVVREEERERFEAQARAEGFADYQISEPDPAAPGRLRPAGRRPLYCPVYFSEPVVTNQPVLGYDLLSGPLAPFLASATDSGKAVGTSKLQLLPGLPARAVMGVLAVYDPRQPNRTPEERRAALRGYVQLVCDIDTLVRTAVTGNRKTGFDLMLLDATNPTPEGIMTFLPAELRTEPIPRPPPARFTGPLARNFLDHIGQKEWIIACRPSPEWLAQNTSWYPGAVLLIGLLITGGIVRALASANLRTRIVAREVEARTRELSDLNGSYAEEIRQRRQVEEVLARERTLLRTLLDTLPEQIYVKDTAGRYLLTNEANRRLRQLRSTEEVVGKTVFDLVSPEHAARYDADDRQVITTGQAILNREEPGRFADGADRVLLTSKLPLRDGAGQIIGLVGITRDITGEKRAGQEKEQLTRRLQETQKLESLGVLAGGVAHDFNNILTSVLGYASLTRLELEGHPAAAAHLEQIEQAALRAAELCKQMLAYSGRGHFVVQQVNLSRLVEEALPLLQVSFSKRITLRQDLERDLPAVIADVTQIRQIIMNLVINAADAIGEPGGGIHLATGVMQADRAYLDRAYLSPAIAEGAYVYLEVRDNGCGMRPETLARIFEPFFSTKFTGRGLGLAAVLGIVRGHGGAIRVDSEPGEGTTFRLLLPAALGQALPAAREPAPVHPGWRGQGTVLVVDDEENVREVSARILEALGFSAVLAVDGEDALNLIARRPGPFVAVLLDLTMPRMDGAETFARLQRFRPGLPVLLMSGYSEQEAVGRFTGAGFAGFIQKPFHMQELRQRLQQIIEGRRPA
jgi:two-component system cell cycle sensor histidine kinase/response regulator CckA